MAHALAYMPRIFGGRHFVVWGRLLKLPPHVADTLNEKIKNNFITCLVRGTPEQLRYFFKSDETYVLIQKKIQEAIKNAPHQALMRKVHIAVYIGASVVFFAVGITSLAKL